MTLLRFLGARLLMAAATLLAATVAVTVLIHLVPGDPVRTMYAQSQGTTPEQIEQMRSALGLDQPVLVQYWRFLVRLLHGDMGRTVRGNQPVAELVLARLPNTLALALAAMVVAAVVGILAGFAAAWRRGTWLDWGLMTVAVAGISVPPFWLGLVLLFVFAVDLRWLPVGGTGPAALVLPALTLGVANAAAVARLTRAAMVDVMGQEFVRTARAKGLPRALVLQRHVLRAGLLPVVTMMALQFAYLMGGAVVVETIFAWNGLGRLAIEAIFQRDYPVIQGFVLVFAATVVGVSILLDLLYALLDPRVRRG